MKYTIIISMLMANLLYGLVGFGLTGGTNTINSSGGRSDIFVSVPDAGEQKVGQFSNEGFNSAISIGGYLYVDALPFVDIDFEVGLKAAPYYFNIENQSMSQDSLAFMWASGYYFITVQKKILQLKIPFIAKAKLFGGLGVHNHTSTPMINQKMLESVMEGGVEDGDFNTQKMIEYLDKNKESTGGLHLQLGGQFKLLTFDTMMIYRYVFTDGITSNTDGFSDISFRFGLGL